MAGSQTLAFNVVGDASSAARAFKATADSAALAARGAKSAADALDLQAKSAQVSSAATLALARADKILADAELGLARDTAVANAVLGRQNAALLGDSTAGAVGAMLAAAASGKAPPSGGAGKGVAPGIAMAAAAMGIASKQTRLFSDSISQGIPVWDGARKGIFGLNGELALFGGALKSAGIPSVLSAATTVHLLTEAVVETGGTLIPAAIAFGVFGAAAVPAVQAVYAQVKNLHTVTTALGTQMPGLSGNFSKMAAAVQPQVYQLFGEALVFANSGTGQLQKLATGAGKVLDDLGARFVAATTGGKGFGTFIGKATSDLAGWGNVIGNVGGIFGNLLKVLPGYAEDLLNVLQGVTHGIETVTGSGLGQWVLGIGLAAHGAVFYIGILGTGLAVLASRGLALAAAGALSAATAVEGLGVAGEAASGGLLAFAGAAEGAAALPWGWISIAAAGLGFLAYQMASAKSAAQQFGDALAKTVSAASLNILEPTIAGAIQQADAALVQAQRDAAGAQAALQRSSHATGRGIGNLSDSLNAARGSASQYRDVLSGLQQEQQLVAGRVNALAKEYGGQTAALAMLNQAGITSAQVTDKDSQHWKQALIEIRAQAAALDEMSLGAGRTAAGMNALGNAFLTGPLPAMQKMTQAEDALMSLVTSGQQGFIAWAQGVHQADKDASAYHATLSGLNAQSLTLANDYYGTLIPASQKLNDALQAQGASTKDLRTAVADEVRQMLPFTRGNIAAQSVLVDLVNNALGPGTVSLQSLSRWTVKNSGTMGGFRAIVDKATVSAGNLAGTLSGLLNSAFAADLLKASGAAGAVSAYARAIVTSGSSSQATRGARSALITDLEKAGYSAKDAAAYVDGLQRKIDAMHGKTVGVSVRGSGSGKITFAEQNIRNAQTGFLEFHAAGGLIGGSGSGDTVPAMLTPGEVVVPRAMVAAGAVDHLRGQLPGFASGGLVGQLAGAPDWVAGAEGAAAKSVMGSAASAMISDMQAKVAAAATAAARLFTGSGGGSGGIIQAMMMHMAAARGWTGPQWAALANVENREAGWNMTAVNPTSGAYGLAQFIGGPSEYYAYGGNPTTAQGQITGMLNYIAQRYGSPAAAWAHEVNYGWYDSGGPLMPGYTLAYNGTGKPEMVVPNRGGGSGGGDVHVHLHNHGVIGSRQELENWLHDSVESLARKGRLKWTLQQSASARG